MVLLIHNTGIVAKKQNEFLSVTEKNTSNAIQLSFEAAEDVELSIKVISDEHSYTTEIENNYKHLTYLERVHKNGCIIASIVLPHKGNFVVLFYGCRRSLQVVEKWNSKIFLGYFIECTKPIPSNIHIRYPVIKPIEASRTRFKLLKWCPRSRECYVAENTSGKAAVEFKCAKGIEIHHCLIDKSGDSYKYYTSLCSCSNNTVTELDQAYILHIVFPKQGLWTIEVAANKKIMSYTVYAHTALKGQCYPCISMPDEIELDPHELISLTNKEILSIPFSVTSPHYFKGFIRPVPNSQETKVDHDPTHVSKEGPLSYQLNAVFPYPRKWIVGVMIGTTIINGEINLSEAFSVIVHVKESECRPTAHFPQLHPSSTDFTVTIPKVPVAADITNNDPVRIEFNTQKELVFSHLISYRDSTLKGFTFLECVNDKPLSYILQAVFPHKGDWHVKLYAGVGDDKSHKKVLSLHITFDPPTIPCSIICGFPEIFPEIAHLTKFKLIEWNAPEKKHIAENAKGTMDIIFNARTGEDFSHYLEKGKEKLHTFTYLCPPVSLTPTTQQWTLKVILPCAEKFILKIFRRRSYCVMQYAIHAKVCLKGKSFPRLLPEFSTLGLQLSPNSTPCLYIVDNIPRDVTVEMISSEELLIDLSAKHNGQKIQGVTSFSTVSQSSNIIYCLSVNVNNHGKWEMDLYARKHDNNSNTLYPVLVHEIDAK